MKTTIFSSLPVTTGSDAENVQPIRSCLKVNVYHPWKFLVSVFTDTEILRKKYLNLWTPYLTTGSRFYQKKLLTWDICNVYNMCKIQDKNFIHKRDIWLWKWDNERVFLITGSGRLNFRWGILYLIFQRELNKVV